MAEYKNLTSSEEKILDAMLKNGGLTAAQEAELLEAAIAVEQERLSGNIKNGNFAESLINKIKDSTLLSDDQKSQLLNFAAEAEKEEMKLRSQNNQNTDTAPAGPQDNADTSADAPADDTADDTGSESAADNVVTNDAPTNDTPAAPKIPNLEKMNPSELLEVRKDLNTKTTSEAVAQNIELENHVVGQAKKYNEGQAVVTVMEEVYALQELLESVRQNPQGQVTRGNVQILDDAIAKSTEEINNFEEEYGIADNILQTPEVVARNITDLDKLPSDDDLFALDIKPEKLQSPTAYQDVVAILQSAERNKSVPEISVLAGTLQCKELNGEQKNKLLDYAYQQVGQASKLEQKNFKNFEFLLEALKEYPKPEAKRVINGKSKMLAKAREQYQQQAPLKNKEFQDVYNVIKSLEVKGPLKTFGRKTIAQTGKDSDIAMFMSQVRNQTEMYLANTQTEIKPEVFKQEYADRLAKGLTEVVCGDRISKGQVVPKDFEKMFGNLAQAAKKRQTIKINQDSIIGWQAARTTRSESAVNKLSQKKGFKEVAKTFGDRLKNLDGKLSKKYGVLYNMARGALKSGGWGIAYAAAGSTLGPVGIAAVATASFANQSYAFIRDFKKARQAAIKEGRKPDSFFQHLKKNKMRAAGLLLSGAGAAIGIGGFGDIVAVQAARSGAGISLAAAGAFRQASDAYNKTKGSKRKKVWAAIRAFGVSGASFAVGMFAGRHAGELVSESMNSYAPDMSVENSPLADNIDNQNNEYFHDSPENAFGIQGRDDVTIPLRPEDQMVNDVPNMPERQTVLSSSISNGHVGSSIHMQDTDVSGNVVGTPDNNIGIHQDSVETQPESQSNRVGLFVDDNSGQEVVLNNEQLENLGEGIRHWENIREVHYNSETHDLMYKLQDDNGNLISITMNEQGEITALNTGTTEYSQEQLNFINDRADEIGFTHYKDQYNGLSSIMERIGQENIQVVQGQTLGDVLQSHDHLNDTITTLGNDNIQQDGSSPQVSAENSNISEELGRASAQAYIDEVNLSQANADLGMFVSNENGQNMYSYGLGESPDMNMAMELHNTEVRNAMSAYHSLQDLEARADTLTPEEMNLKADLQTTLDGYAEQGLTFNDEGRTVFANDLLKSEARQENLSNEAPTREPENPVQETPVREPETPVQETPAQESPVQEAPAQESPVQEAPAQESPVQEAPAQEAPAQEAPAQETPAQEQPSQQFTSGQVYGTQDGVAWQIGEKGEIEVTQAASRDVQIEASKLTPQVVQQPDGSYKCGYFSSPDPQVAEDMQQHALEVTLNKESVAAEFRQMQAEGRPLPEGADKFLADHEAGLKTLGLQRDENGNLVRADSRVDTHVRSEAERISELRGTAKPPRPTHYGQGDTPVKTDNTQGFVPKRNNSQSL